jgi:hypothetical protein
MIPATSCPSLDDGLHESPNMFPKSDPHIPHDFIFINTSSSPHVGSGISTRLTPDV